MKKRLHFLPQLLILSSIDKQIETHTDNQPRAIHTCQLCMTHNTPLQPAALIHASARLTPWLEALDQGEIYPTPQHKNHDSFHLNAHTTFHGSRKIEILPHFNWTLFAHRFRTRQLQTFPSMPVCWLGTRTNPPTPDLQDRHSFLRCFSQN